MCSIPTNALNQFKWVNSFLTAAVIVTNEQLNLITFFIAKVPPYWKLNPGFVAQKNCLFPLNRGVPSMEVTNSKVMWTSISGTKFCDPWMEVAQRRGFIIVSILIKPKPTQQKCLTLLSTNALLMRVNESPAIKKETIKMGECGHK